MYTVQSFQVEILGAHIVIENLLKYLIFVAVLNVPPLMRLDLFNLTFSPMNYFVDFPHYN